MTTSHTILLSVLAVAAGAALVGFNLLTSPTGAVANATTTTDGSGTAQTIAVASPVQAVQSPSGSVGGGGIHLSGDAAVVAPGNPSADKLDKSAISTDNKQASIYTVREGDTLEGISELFDVSVNTIVWANDLEDGTIHPGDTLVVLPVSGVRHEVKEGETVSELADRFGVSAEKIREYNELKKADQLATGAILDIPGGEKPQRAKQNSSQTNTGVTGTHQPSRTASSRSVSTGYFLHPLPDSRRSQGLHGYNAVDFAAPTGSAVRAAASGQVTKSVGAGWNGGYGKFIVVRHPNGTKTLYSHLSSVIVARGQRIAKGQTLGYVGDTGHSTGPHLHFEVRGTRNPF